LHFPALKRRAGKAFLSIQSRGQAAKIASSLKTIAIGHTHMAELGSLFYPQLS
jgi:hypothetical protein